MCKPAKCFYISANTACSVSSVALVFCEWLWSLIWHVFKLLFSQHCHMSQSGSFPLHNKAKPTRPHFNSFSKPLFSGCCISWHTMFYITKHETQLPPSHFHTCQLHDLKIGEICQVRGREWWSHWANVGGHVLSHLSTVSDSARGATIQRWQPDILKLFWLCGSNGSLTITLQHRDNVSIYQMHCSSYISWLFYCTRINQW